MIPKGSGYKIIQSKVATEGMMGFGNGSQFSLSFLAEKHTGFMFSIIDEQLFIIGVFDISNPCFLC